MERAVFFLFCYVCGRAKSIGAEFPPGDVAACNAGKDVKRFEVLPGGGWDNLRNKPGGRVASFNYSLCRLTEDMSYLIPDNTYVIPVKQSSVDSFAEIISHWSDYKSTTSTSVNVGASFSGFGVSVSGSFSYEHSQVKEKQVKDNSSTVKVTLKQHRYTLALQPGFQLHPEFKGRLLDVAAHIKSNNTRVVDYELDLLVRDYGSHVITSVEAGAGLAQIQQVRTSYVQEHEKKGTSVEVKASASANFFVSVGFHSDVKHSSSDESTKGYESSLTHSQIVTYGGPAIKSDFKLNDWEKEVPNSLVAIDRAGSPLNLVINKNNMREISEVTLYKLTRDVERAIGRYYKFNTVLGCTDHTSSANFDYQANVDDGSCGKEIRHFDFGGVYQTTHIELLGVPKGLYDTDALKQLNQVNPLKRGYSCPGGFKEALIKEGVVYSSQRYCSCVRPTTCACRYLRLTTYKSYYCYKISKGNALRSTGLLYGGFYTSTTSNQVTDTHSCPAKFYPLRIGRDIKICVSDSFEEGASFSRPFGGFFSCQAGNPLLFEDAPRGLESFVKSQPPSSWPRRCPIGYSQHLVTIEDDCEIRVCTRSKGLQVLKIKRPPFQRPPQQETMSNLQPAAKIWTRLDAGLVPESHIHQVAHQSDIQPAARRRLQGSEIAGVSVAATLFVAAIVMLMVIGFRRNLARTPYRNIDQQMDNVVGNVQELSHTGFSNVLYQGDEPQPVEQDSSCNV